MDRTVKSILIGSILGDGHIEPSTRNGSRWVVKYDDKYLPYLDWLHRSTRSLRLNEIKAKKNYHQHYFATKPLKELAYYREHFYPEGKKIIPEDMGSLLKDNLSLAVWYMDDGNLDFRNKYHFNASIATFCFSYKECVHLALVLKDNFDIEARVHKSTMRGKLQYRLYIAAGSMERFIDLIRPYIQSVFLYKIGL